MSKKDVLIFLHIYLLSVRDLCDKCNIKFFREDMYSLLSNYSTFVDFKLFVKTYYNHIPLYKNFIEYLERINKVLDN